ncbi:MAG TPA: transporter [Oxalicibacterium sp.]|nr:transporter [Oxalicibacterium sp.]
MLKGLILAAAASVSLPAAADTLPPVTPYRPSVASPAQLPSPGQLELEMGGLSVKTDGDHRDSLPYQLKLALSDQWGLLLGGEALVSDRQGGERSSGFGDTSFTLKRAFALDDKTGLGLELTAKAPTARDGLGSGKADYTLNGIFSKDVGALHMDLNLNETRLGAIDPGTGRMQTGWAASFSTALDERWTATAELSGTQQARAAHTAQLLAAVTYNPTPRMAIDVGVAKGLTDASQDWSLFSGIVLPLANFW